MPLINFGSILNFAEELETIDRDFYTTAAQNPACAPYRDLFEQFARDAQKNIRNVQRTRRENVTEMILEQISGFTREPFCETFDGVESMTERQAVETAQRLEERAERYYREAAEKLKALSEVSRALKMLGKKHAARCRKLQDR